MDLETTLCDDIVSLDDRETDQPLETVDTSLPSTSASYNENNVHVQVPTTSLFFCLFHLL